MNILIKDNFLDSVEIVRNIGLLSKYTCSEELDVDPGWRGYRSEEWEENNSLLDSINRNIIYTVSNHYGLSEYNNIKTYFHLTYERTKDTLINFDEDKMHYDMFDSYAGIIYLTPNPPKNSGTTIDVFDMGPDGDFINVENVYNRIVSYPGDLWHGPTDLFGDTKETCRMTITFFIFNDKSFANYFKKW